MRGQELGNMRRKEEEERKEEEWENRDNMKKRNTNVVNDKQDFTNLHTDSSGSS